MRGKKKLLSNKDLAILAVAMECGYIDSGYFARVFKQETGLTPQEWKTYHALAG